MFQVMVKMSYFKFNPNSFKTNWPIFPYNGIPAYPVAGPAAAICRRVVRQVFHPKMFAELRDRQLTLDELWVLSVTVWLRRLRRLQIIVKRRPDIVPQSEATLFRMLKCAPSGYRLVNPRNRSFRYCWELVCPFCHARRVAAYAPVLTQVMALVPPTTPLYAGRFAVTGDYQAASKEAQRRRVAAGFSTRFQVTRFGGQWRHQALFVSDDIQRLVGLSAVHEFQGAKAVVMALSGALAYPTWWRSPGTLQGMVSAFRDDAVPTGRTRRVRHYATLGAARSDYVSGRGLLDFSVYEPKT